ncbi:ZPR1 zinc-finger domain-containing protein [Pisolithus albus]|nr:ZPR1 zinc-finger domain-containing protein [Pisolithus albus]
MKVNAYSARMIREKLHRSTDKCKFVYENSTGSHLTYQQVTVDGHLCESKSIRVDVRSGLPYDSPRLCGLTWQGRVRYNHDVLVIWAHYDDARREMTLSSVNATTTLVTHTEVDCIDDTTKPAKRRRDMNCNAEFLSERVQRDGFLQPPVVPARQLAEKATGRPHTPTKMIQLSENYSILGDEEETENEADEAGRISSATEKSKEDPIEKAITIKLDDLSGTTFIKILGSISHPSGRSRRMRSKSRFGVTSSAGILDGTGGYLRIHGNVFAVCASTHNSHEKRFDSVLPGARFLGIDFQCNAEASFKDTLIVSTNCGHCGYWDNKVKVWRREFREGKENHLRIKDREDLSRDILKSETCGLTIPKIDPVMQPGTLGGRSTIVEGFSELSEKVYMVGIPVRWWTKVTNAEEPSTLLLNDPLANLYLQNLYLRDPDLNMEIVTYERKWQPNEELGLNDMKVEN